jgi:hypothetical protein
MDEQEGNDALMSELQSAYDLHQHENLHSYFIGSPEAS